MTLPDVLVVNGVEYEHRCDPFRDERPRKRKWICPCGQVWTARWDTVKLGGRTQRVKVMEAVRPGDSEGDERA